MTASETGAEATGADATWVGLLRSRAEQRPEKRALIFLRDGETQTNSLTYAQLDRQARSIAAHLQSRMAEGGRVLLLYPSGLDFLAGFFGCLYAGMIAVPASLPRLNRNCSRLISVIEDAAPVAALTTESTFVARESMIGESGLDSLDWIRTDTLNDASNLWCEPALDGRSAAFLQYTSGSTSRPKGVVVSQQNLLENHRMLQCAFEQTEDSMIVTWLPLFHDMGLIGNVLQALFLGSTCVLLPPEMFLVKPVRWLQAVSRYRAHTSGAPNFAYELCAKKVTDEQRSSLDLSGWRVAFNGAEPVRHETLERFSKAFASCGFNKEALYPCYGLAEATLFVAGGTRSEGAVAVDFCARELALGRAAPVAAAGVRKLVSCGRTWLAQEIAIVNPETMKRCDPECIGEIWVSGPNVAQGYWNRAGESEATFRASLKDEAGRTYLRTGDLGFFHGGRLFVAGRLKDLIIVAGRNHHPEDIEETVEKSHPAIRAGCCAVFSVERHGEERVVVAAELERGYEVPARAALVRTVCEMVATGHEITVDDVVLLRPGGVPKTTSGKIQRHVCRESFLAGTLNAWNLPE